MHVVEPNEITLHGYWSCELKPVLTVQPGESVRYRTLAANWKAVEDGKLTEFVQREKDELRGHALCGPIEIAGAKAGMVLEIQIGTMIPDALGYNRGGGNPDLLPFQRFGTAEGDAYLCEWQIDVDSGLATGSTGHMVKIAPFMGVMGMPPEELGRHSTTPPRTFGGNLDCKDLVAGTSLYLPVPVDGALFSVGDGHAVQGDGEISGTAIECPMSQLDLTFVLHEDMTLNTPLAKTHEGWLTLGFHEDLNEAAWIAGNAMLDFIMRHYRVNRKEALTLASVAVDLRVTQIVNIVKGVHAVLPDGAIR